MRRKSASRTMPGSRAEMIHLIPRISLKIMASFFKNLFRKEGDSQPVPAAPLSNNMPDPGRLPHLQEAISGNTGREGLLNGSSGPFSAAMGRDMTARELAALLPPALLRFDGISPDQPVPLPVEALRQSLRSGRPVMRLSQIQSACPLLFQRPLREDEDMDVTLPIARVKGILEASGPVEGAHTAFMAAPAVTSANPFASILPASAAASASPFAVASAPVGAIAVGPFTDIGNRFPISSVPAQSFIAPDRASVAPSGSPFSAAPPAQFPVTASPFATMASPMPAPAGFPQLPVAAPLLESRPSPFGIAPPTEAPTLLPLAPSAFPLMPKFAPEAEQKPSPFTPMALAGSADPIPPPVASPPSIPSPFAAVALPAPAVAPRIGVLPTPLPGSLGAASPPLPPLASPPPLSLPVLPRAVQAPFVVSAPVVPTISAPVVTSITAKTSAPIPQVETAGSTVELSLRAVLRDAEPARLGFAPENVPEAVRVLLPLDLVLRQLATGRVEIGIEDICAGISGKFRPAFARAASDLRIVVPMSEVFHNLPESARPVLPPALPVEEHQSITTSPFQTPFAIKAEEDRGKQLLDLSATGFDGTASTPRPATLPVPVLELPPAPLPLIQLPVGAAPAAGSVELPTLRPVVSASPVPPAESPALPPLSPRPGVLSRPPGSGTAPTPPRAAPRLKFVPVSPTALRPFPKPAPLTNSTPVASPALPPASFQADHSSLPPILPLAAISPAFPGTPPPLKAVAPQGYPDVAPSDSSDDLGESFSAASLGAEPPPRAGSAPVSLLGTMAETIAFSPVSAPLAELAPALHPDVPAVAEPVTPVGPVLPAWPSNHQTPPAPVAPVLLPSLTVAARPDIGTAPGLSTGPVIAEAVPPVLPVWPGREVLDDKTGTPIAATAPIPPRIDPSPRIASAPQEDLTFGCIADVRQLMLRAVLGTDQVLTPQDIVDHCAAFPGLKACVLLQRDAILTSRGMDETDAAAFRASAVKTRDSLVTLAETMGLGQGGNFTLRTDHGIRSFFLDSNLCLAVWHAQPNFSGGTREKLILIAQELSKS